MADPVISEIKYLGNGDYDFLEVRVPDDYPDPENLVLVIYDKGHNGSTTGVPSVQDVYNVTTEMLLYDGDLDNDGTDDDGLLHYLVGSAYDGTNIRLHAQDAVGLYNSVTGETYGLYSWGAPYTVSTNSGDPFAGQSTTVLDTTGQVVNTSSLAIDENGDYQLDLTPEAGESVICFCDGTMIETVSGPRAVETLQAGDFVVTKDHGLQPIRWIGRRSFGADTAEHLRPYTVEKDAFGEGRPNADLTISPQHQLLIHSVSAELLFGDNEVLASAKALADHPMISNMAQCGFTYHHILLDQHSLIKANGMWSESLFLGQQSLYALSNAARAEVFEIFPDVEMNIASFGNTVRKTITRSEAVLLI